MDFISFLQKDKDNSSESDEPISLDTEEDSKVDFLKGVDEKELGPKPKNSGSGSFNSPNRSSSSRLNDMLLSTPPENDLAQVATEDVLPEEPVEEKVSKNPESKIKNFFKKFKKDGTGKSNFLSKGGERTLEVNLVKDEIIQYFDWQKNILFLLLAAFASIFLLTLSYWGISWWGSRMQVEKDQFLTQDYYRLNKQVRDLDPEVKEVTAFQEKLNMVNYLLGKHIYWTNFFDFLEKNTLTDVYLFSFVGDTGGRYKVSGRARYFEVLDAQVKKFLEDPIVTSAQIKSGSVVSGQGKADAGVSFEMSFSVNPSIFYK